MQTQTWATTWTFLRLAMAAAIFAAVITQLVASITTTAEAGRDVGTVIANFFSFFTILSNLIAAVVLTWAGIRGVRPHPAPRIDTVALAHALACATTYMVITGVVYNVLLRNVVLPQGSEPVAWSNETLHLIAPIFLLLDVFVGPGRRALPWRSVLLIIVFPLLWTAYTLVRGPLVTNPVSGDPFWYPYPFLNPNGPGGWGSVIVYVVIIAVAFAVVALGVVWAGRRRARS
ncbi:Pr6Pr family membrane protein [Microbacterium sp. W1N]|uniref:Pr6Pr family membrane protein n=1 Tax=Microbacterium festucae TaxID=2977531 RepID=UPI0021C03C1D|nr:Pr6Pr family membrane protein [Microbacterium festucae]MCT9819422.1 Pr6Pr family membrane protein [Microbacterium festucae]